MGTTLTLHEQFAAAITAARGSATLREYAPKIGLSPGELSRIESGKSTPKFETLQKIGKLAGITIRVTIHTNTK